MKKNLPDICSCMGWLRLVEEDWIDKSCTVADSIDWLELDISWFKNNCTAALISVWFKFFKQFIRSILFIFLSADLSSSRSLFLDMWKPELLSDKSELTEAFSFDLLIFWLVWLFVLDELDSWPKRILCRSK